MSESSTASVIVEAPLAEVAAKLTAIADYPQWLTSIKKVEIDSSDDNGRVTQATVSIDAGVMKDRATLSYDWSAAAGLTVVSGYATTATTRISGGTLGRDYSLTCTLTFTSGQILPCVVLVQVRKR